VKFGYGSLLATKMKIFGWVFRTKVLIFAANFSREHAYGGQASSEMLCLNLLINGKDGYEATEGL
jgi:hypothetical protein